MLYEANKLSDMNFATANQVAGLWREGKQANCNPKTPMSTP